MPVVRGNTALLPIMPVRILFNGGPEFSRGKRDAMREALYGSSQVQCYEHPANIKNDGTKRSVMHELVLCGIGCRARRWRGLPALQNSDDRGKDRKDHYHRNHVVNILADVRN